MRLTGTVKWFNGPKGYGFIRRDDKGPDLFVHSSEVRRTGWGPVLTAGERVEFLVSETPKGPAASSVYSVSTPDEPYQRTA